MSRSREETEGLFSCSHQAEQERSLFLAPCLGKSSYTSKYIYKGGSRWPRDCNQASKTKMKTLQELLQWKRCLRAYEPCSLLSLRLLPLSLPVFVCSKSCLLDLSICLSPKYLVLDNTDLTPEVEMVSEPSGGYIKGTRNTQGQMPFDGHGASSAMQIYWAVMSPYKPTSAHTLLLARQEPIWLSKALPCF